MNNNYNYEALQVNVAIALYLLEYKDKESIVYTPEEIDYIKQVRELKETNNEEELPPT